MRTVCRGLWFTIPDGGPRGVAGRVGRQRSREPLFLKKETKGPGGPLIPVQTLPRHGAPCRDALHPVWTQGRQAVQQDEHRARSPRHSQPQHNPRACPAHWALSSVVARVVCDFTSGAHSGPPPAPGLASARPAHLQGGPGGQRGRCHSFRQISIPTALTGYRRALPQPSGQTQSEPRERRPPWALCLWTAAPLHRARSLQLQRSQPRLEPAGRPAHVARAPRPAVDRGWFCLLAHCEGLWRGEAGLSLPVGISRCLARRLLFDC